MANKVYTGAAADVQQVDTITIADTWASGDTITLTRDSNTLVLTVDTSTTATIASELAAMINAQDRTTSLVGSESRSAGGQSIPHFRELSALASGSVVTVTVKTAGKPVTYTVGETTAGDGTATKASVQVATGKGHLDNALNWSGDALPGNGDMWWFMNSSLNIQDGLDGLSDENVPAAIHVLASFTGTIGRPDKNTDDAAYPYDEDRPRRLVIPNSTAGDVSLYVGSGDGAGSPLLRFLWADSTGNFKPTIHKTFTLATGHAVDLQISATSTGTLNDVVVRDGSVGINQDASETAGTIDDLTIGLPTHGTDEGPRVFVGGTATIAEDVVQHSGTSRVYPTVGGDLTIDGGQMWFHGGTITGTMVIGAKFYLISLTGSPTALYLENGGDLDLSEAEGTIGAFNPRMHKGSTFRNPDRRVAAQCKLIRCGFDDVTIDVGTDFQFTPGIIT